MPLSISADGGPKDPRVNDMNPNSVVSIDNEVMGGTPVFVGTRVPVKSLFDYLEGGDTVDEFLRQFPSVGREQAIAALNCVRVEFGRRCLEFLHRVLQ